MVQPDTKKDHWQSWLFSIGTSRHTYVEPFTNGPDNSTMTARVADNRIDGINSPLQVDVAPYRGWGAQRSK